MSRATRTEVTSLEKSERAEVGAQDEHDDPVPIFGSWGRIYTAVILSALVVMGLVALFSHWEF
jgi:hypothetical protein